MSIKVRIPTPLQKMTGNKGEVEAKGSSVKEILASLEKQFPGMKERLYDEKGNLRRFINFYVNNEDIRFLKGDTTPVKDGDELSIVPAIAGGADLGLAEISSLDPVGSGDPHPHGWRSLARIGAPIQTGHRAIPELGR